MKKWVVLFVLIIVCMILGAIYECVTNAYVVIDCGPLEVQKVIAEVNQGVGEGSYDNACIVYGKDSYLVASCMISSITWKNIVSKGILQNDAPIPNRIESLAHIGNRRPLGCCIWNDIDYYGFENEEGYVYLVIVNSGDVGGNFPKAFWRIITENVK